MAEEKLTELRFFTPGPGATVFKTAQAAIEKAKELKCDVAFIHNETMVVVGQHSDPIYACETWEEKRKQGRFFRL